MTALPELVMAPLLVGCATLACRWWGMRIGGLVSAFPAVVGPVLLITLHDRGAAFTARAANGTLLGLIALGGFVLAYGRVAVHAGWRLSLLAGWALAATVTALSWWLGAHLAFPGGFVVGTLSLAAAHTAMPRASVAYGVSRTSRHEISVRMALTAGLVALLAGAAEVFGPLAGGILAALPVLASVLAVSTHRQDGSDAVVALLRGMLSGMAGFVGFCAVIAMLVVPAGAPTAFASATVAAIGLQALAIGGSRVASGWFIRSRRELYAK